MSSRGVEFRGEDVPKISSVQKEVLDMILIDHEIPRRIALRRQTSLAATYKIIKKLKAKGLLKGRFDRGVEKVGIAPAGGVEFHTLSYKIIRLHRQEFNAKILARTGIYAKLKAQTPIMALEGNKIRLYGKSVEIYCSPSRAFEGPTPRAAWDSSMIYWDSFFRKVEEKLGILLIKPGHIINQVNAHYAEVGNELAVQAVKERQKIQLKAPEDGRVWGIVDASLGSAEFETLHPRTALQDMQEVVQPFFNDLRSYYAQTGQMLIMTDMLKGLGQMAATAKVMDSNMMSHIGAVQELGQAVRELRAEIKKLK